jgi:hypothetical protein
LRTPFYFKLQMVVELNLMGIFDWFHKRKSLPSPIRHFHITIGVASLKAFDLENALRMLRTALIYADQVKLCSTNMSQMYAFLGYSNNLNGFVDFLEKCLPLKKNEQSQEKIIRQLSSLREALRKNQRQLVKEELLLVSFAKRCLKERQNDFKTKYPTLTKESEIKAITKAIKNGVLELHTFQSLEIETLAAAFYAGETNPQELGEISPSAKAVYEEYMDIVSTSVAEGTTYPMFDDNTGLLVKARLDESGIAPSDIRMQRVRHSALAANLLEQLPDFGLTPIDELLDIRTELQASLDRFRGGVSTYAAGIKSAPWNKDFAAEADELFIQKVKPGIQEIEEMVKSGSSPIWHIGREVNKAKSLIGGGAAIGFLIDTPDSLSKYVKAMLGSVLPLSFAVGEGVKNYSNEKSKIRSHTLYFYYRLRDKVKQ